MRSFVFAGVVLFLFLVGATTVACAAQPGKVAERWAVLVGVDDYANANDLRYCGADQSALRDRLVAFGFRPENIVLLNDAAQENRHRPSRGNIERQLQLVIDNAEADDLLVVSFSGHGVSLAGKSYLCPSDADLADPATLIPLDDVYERLNQCAARFKLVLVDACRNDPTPGGRRSLSATEGTRQLARSLQEIRLPQGVVLLNSCAPGEISWEEQDFGHGVYMHFVLEALDGAGDENADGAISLNELQRYASSRTRSYVIGRFNSSQRPFSRSEGESEALDFALLRVKTATPSAVPVPSTAGGSSATAPAVGTRTEFKTPDGTGLTLPGQFDKVVVGGGGRFLIFFLPQQKQLAVFDSTVRQIIKYLPVPTETIQFTADMEHLFVYVPVRNVIERWSLSTFVKESSQRCPLSATVVEMVMGSASTGPLVLGASGLPFDPQRPGGLRFYDAKTYKEIVYQPQASAPGSIRPPSFDADGGKMRISANGKVLTTWRTRTSPGGLAAIVFSGTTLRGAYEHTTVGYILPTPDGKYLCTRGQIYTADCKPINSEPPNSHVWYLPSLNGAYHLAYREVVGSKPAQVVLTVHAQGEESELMRFGEIPALPGLVDWISGKQPDFSQHLHFLPNQNLLVVVPATRDRLLLYNFDLDAALEESGIDYLVVVPEAPNSVKKGTTFSHTLRVKSKRGGVHFRLDSGPTGMTISPEGRLEWNVPRYGKEDAVTVIVTVSDATGQETLHHFELAITN